MEARTKPSPCRDRAFISDPDTGMSVQMIKYAAGFTNPWRRHNCAHGIYVLDGTLRTHEGTFGPGSFVWFPEGMLMELLADPGLAGALGFQLSVAATAGVLWLGPAVARALPDRIPERVRRAAGMTLGAQATAVPALALALGPVSLAGLPANLLGLPLAGGPMLLGVIAAATAPIAPWAATLACRLADPFLLALIAVARWAAGLPGGSVTLTGPARAVPAVLVLLVVVAVVARRRSPFCLGPS